MEDPKKKQCHCLYTEKRQGGRITGVKDIHSFDEKELLVLTEEGKMLIKGKELHVKQLNLEQGEMEFEGHLDQISYLSAARSRNEEKIWKKIFQ